MFSVTISSTSVLVAILFVVAMATIVRGNSLEKSQCPENQIIKKIIYKNSRWIVKCRDAGRTSSCVEEGYDILDQPNLFICPMDSVITGIRNDDHDSKRQWPRLIFRCCNVENRKPRNCYTTAYTNEQYFAVPERATITGAYGYYDTDLLEPLWKVLVCSF